MSCIRRILGGPEIISNERLWQRTYQMHVEQEIRHRRWRWIGHTLPKPVDIITRQALTWNPEGKGKEDDRETHGAMIWKPTSKKLATQLERLAQDQSALRSPVSGLCPRRGDEGFEWLTDSVDSWLWRHISTQRHSSLWLVLCKVGGLMTLNFARQLNTRHFITDDSWY